MESRRAKPSSSLLLCRSPMNHWRIASLQRLALFLFWVQVSAFSIVRITTRKRSCTSACTWFISFDDHVTRTFWNAPLCLSAASMEKEEEEAKEEPNGQFTNDLPTSTTSTTTPMAAIVASTNATSNNPPTALALQQQAAALRVEIQMMQANILASQQAKRQKELADIDRWIEECLYVTVPVPATNTTNSNNSQDQAADVQLLHSVDRAAQVLRDKRYSHEQVSKMFQRICDTSPAQSRSNCSPLLALLVDAAGKLDCVERDENPNKRWDGRVERDLRQRLFAMDWGIDLEESKSNDRFL